MKKLLWIVLGSCISLLVSSHPLLAEDLTGKVVDPDGGAVPNASLRLYDKNSGQLRTTRTSPDGMYSFKGIPAGEYLLEGDASNSALNGSKPISIESDRTENLELKVTSRTTEISVTANSTPVSVQQDGKAIDVIDAKELALRNELSVGDAVRTFPGVRVQTHEGPGSYTEIKTRGLRAADTALLIDGMRFRDATSIQNDATGFYGDLMLVDTDRLEFLRGSGSSLYGSNALGGVLNVVSRTGGGSPRGSLRVEGGGLGLGRGVANLSGGVLEDRLVYSGAASHVYVTKGVREDLPYRNNSLQGSSTFSFTPRLSLTGRAWYSSNFLSSTESPTWVTGMPSNTNGIASETIALPISELENYERGQPYAVGNATFIPNGIDPDGRRAGSFLSGMAILQHQVSSSTTYRVGYQSVDTRRRYTDGPQGPGLFEPGPGDVGSFNGYIDTFQARLDQRAGRHNLITVGYELEDDHYLNFNGGSYGVSSSDRVDLKQRSNAIYIQDQLSLLDRRLQLTVAGRTQFFDLKPPEFQGFTNPYSSQVSNLKVPTAYTGDGALSYFVEGSGTKLRGHVGNSFRAPSGYERFGGGSGFYYGDPRLAPERAVAFDAGIDQWLLDSRLELSGTYFYTKLQQTVRFTSFPAGTDPFNRPFGGYANGGGGIARGMEVSARFSPTFNTKVQASYTYMNSDSRNPTFSNNYYKVLDVSPHIFTLTATQWITRQTSVTFDMAAHSDYDMVLFGGPFAGSSRLFRFSGPVKGDVMVRHDVSYGDDHTLELYGKVENVLNQRPYEDGFIGPKAWFIAGTRINF
jgi:iron complex outermembrane receptor protein